MKFGDQTRLARASGVSKQFINDLLHRRHCASEYYALKLEEASFELGIYISYWDWKNAKETLNPLFREGNR